VPVRRTRWEEVWQEYYVEGSDVAIFKMGPRRSAGVVEVNVVPDNFQRSPSGNWLEGISLSGVIEQTVEYDREVGVDPNNKFEPVSIQVQVVSSDKKRQSSVIDFPLDESIAETRTEQDPANPGRMVERRQFFLARMAPIFIPYSNIRDVLFVGQRGALMRLVTIQITLIGAGGVPIIGPAGPIIFTQPVTIGSFILPTWLAPGAPWPVFNPIGFIPTLQIPMPWIGFRPRPPQVAGGGRPGNFGRPPQPGNTFGGPGAGGWQAPGGAPGTGGGNQPGAPAGGQGQGPQPGTAAGGPGQGGAGQGGEPRIFTSSGSLVPSATAEGVEWGTREVEVPSKNLVTYWFTLPERDGNIHEVALKLTNYSIGLGLANLSVISQEQAPEYRRNRAKIEELPNISIGLETGKEESLRTMDLADQVLSIPMQDRMYILVLAAPTVDDVVVEVEGIPAWALEVVFANQDRPQRFDPDVKVAVN
jgi:hypothetical protein